MSTVTRVLVSGLLGGVTGFTLTLAFGLTGLILTFPAAVLIGLVVGSLLPADAS